LDWNNWKETPELLPAIVFSKDSGEVLPIGSPLSNAARGTYRSIRLPEMRSMQSIGSDKIIGSVEITPEDVEKIDASLEKLSKNDLRRKCEQLLIDRAFGYLFQSR
jgi:hypothetical protein